MFIFINYLLLIYLGKDEDIDTVAIALAIVVELIAECLLILLAIGDINGTF